MSGMRMIERLIRVTCVATLLGSVVPEVHAQSASGIVAPQSDAATIQRVREYRAKSDALAKPERDAANKFFAGAFEAFRAGDFKSAQAGFERGLAQDPANGIARYWLAETLARLNDPRGAREQYRLAAALIPNAPEGQKAQAALVSSPASAARTPPQLPASLDASIRELLASSPLFASLPDTLGVRCTQRMRAAGGSWEQSFARASTPGSGVFFFVEQIGTHEGGRSSRYEVSLTLGGLVSLHSRYSMAGFNSESRAVAFQRAEGKLYPLLSGNWFRIEQDILETIGQSATRKKLSQQCEVHDPVPAGIPGLALPPGDVHRVSCNATMTTGQDPFAFEMHYLCSTRLGMCPVWWPGEAGSAVPDLRRGYSYTRNIAGNVSTYTESWLCEP